MNERGCIQMCLQISEENIDLMGKAEAMETNMGDQLFTWNISKSFFKKVYLGDGFLNI